MEQVAQAEQEAQAVEMSYEQSVEAPRSTPLASLAPILEAKLKAEVSVVVFQKELMCLFIVGSQTEMRLHQPCVSDVWAWLEEAVYVSAQA